MSVEVFDRIARFYDDEHKYFMGDVPFYVDYAKQCGGAVLELGCGTGRVLIPIAQEGIKITGLEISNGMIDVAQKKVKQMDKSIRKNIRFIQGDMKQFNLDQEFSLIYIPFRSFQCLLTKENQGACLGCVKKHLSNKGTFILDLFAPKHNYLTDMKRSMYLGRFYNEENAVYVTRRAETTYNFANQTFHNDFFYEWTDKNDKFHREIWSFELSYLFRYEAELLLEKYGFRVENIFGNFDKSTYNYYSGEQIFVARKVS